MTPEDLRLRFFAAVTGLSHELALRLTHIDYLHDMALIAQPMEREEILGVAHYAADSAKPTAEFAAVRSDLHGQGIGWLLMARLVDVARSHGIELLSGLVLRSNTGTLKFCRDLGAIFTADSDDPLTVRAPRVLKPSSIANR